MLPGVDAGARCARGRCAKDLRGGVACGAPRWLPDLSDVRVDVERGFAPSDAFGGLHGGDALTRLRLRSKRDFGDFGEHCDCGDPSRLQRTRPVRSPARAAALAIANSPFVAEPGRLATDASPAATTASTRFSEQGASGRSACCAGHVSPRMFSQHGAKTRLSSEELI